LTLEITWSAHAMLSHGIEPPASGYEGARPRTEKSGPEALVQTMMPTIRSQFLNARRQSLCIGAIL